MFQTERIIVLVSILWMLVVLIGQAIQARGKGRKDYSAKAGSPMKGVIYNFTWAMTPRHKETIRNHPLGFMIGIFMHIGIFISLIIAFLLIFNSRIFSNGAPSLGIFTAIALACAIYLFVKRVALLDMRMMSSLDDYFSILLMIGLLLVTTLFLFGNLGISVFLISAAIVFFYMPIGKLKHAIFFFLSRADYGARLGYRGTYPIRNTNK